MECKYCNAEIEQDARFCPNCGKDLSKFNKCVKCGELLDKDTDYCSHCGTEQPHYVENYGTSKWTWVLGIILLFCIVGSVGYYYFNNEDEKISEAPQTESMPVENTAAMAEIEKASEEENAIDSVEIVDDADLSVPEEETYIVFGTNGTMQLKKTGYEGSSMSPNTYYAIFGNEDETFLRFNCYPHSKFGKKDFAELTHCCDLKKPISNVSVLIPSFVDLDGKQYKVERVRIINSASCAYPTAGRIVIPSTVEKINLWGLTEFREVVLKDGFEELNERAFRGCPDLESIILPNTLKKIGKLAFENCSGLKKIHIPVSVNDVCDGGAFVGLNKGVTIEVEKGCQALKDLKPIDVEIRGAYGYEHYKFNPNDINIVYVD